MTQSRSDAIRRLLRETLTDHAWASDAAVALTPVYDHPRTWLSDRLLEIQHRQTDAVVASRHVRLDYNYCLEVIFLRGLSLTLQDVAAQV